MICLGYRLQSSGPREFARWCNGLLVSAQFHAGRVFVSVRDADGSITVRRSAATLDCASDKVREVIVRDLPRWADRLWAQQRGAA